MHQVLGTSSSESHKETAKDLHEDESSPCQQFKAVGSLKLHLKCSSKRWTDRANTLSLEKHEGTNKDTATPKARVWTEKHNLDSRTAVT